MLVGSHSLQHKCSHRNIFPSTSITHPQRPVLFSPFPHQQQVQHRPFIPNGQSDSGQLGDGRDDVKKSGFSAKDGGIGYGKDWIVKLAQGCLYDMAFGDPEPWFFLSDLEGSETGFVLCFSFADDEEDRAAELPWTSPSSALFSRIALAQ